MPEPRDPAIELIERLLDDPVFRTAVREHPTAALQAIGLGDAAEALATQPTTPRALDAVESRSSLAGAVIGLAAEALAAADALAHHADVPQVTAAPTAAPVHAPAPPPPHASEQVDFTPTSHVPRRLPRLVDGEPHHAFQRPIAAATAIAPSPFHDLIARAAAREHVDPALLQGLIRTESNFDPDARSPAGALGLCQLMPATAKGLSVDDPLDPKQSIDGGAAYLAGLLHRFHGDRRLAVAAYNAGPGAVEHYGRVPPYTETQKYVQDVLARAEEYRTGAAPPPGHGGGGARLLDVARHELGQREQAWNDSPRIAQYRAAAGGAPPGPWCAYFVSWVAERAGHPLGEDGRGSGSVEELWRWAAAHGRTSPAGAQAHPGDLIVFPAYSHIGIVEHVGSDGRIQTIEGNAGDRVEQLTRRPGEAFGFIRMTSGEQ